MKKIPYRNIIDEYAEHEHDVTVWSLQPYCNKEGIFWTMQSRRSWKFLWHNTLIYVHDKDFYIKSGTVTVSSSTHHKILSNSLFVSTNRKKSSFANKLLKPDAHKNTKDQKDHISPLILFSTKSKSYFSEKWKNFNNSVVVTWLNYIVSYETCLRCSVHIFSHFQIMCLVYLMDQITIKTPYHKGRLFLKIDL